MSINVLLHNTLYSECKHFARESTYGGLHEMRVRRWYNTKRYSGVDDAGTLGVTLNGPNPYRSLRCQSVDQGAPAPTAVDIEYRRELLADKNTTGA